MKAKTRCILFEGIALAVATPAILALTFDAPRPFLWVCVSLPVVAIAVAILFRVKRWACFRNPPPDTIKEKTRDNISALGTLAFVVVFGLAIFLPQLWKAAEFPSTSQWEKIEETPSPTAEEGNDEDLRNSIEN